MLSSGQGVRAHRRRATERGSFSSGKHIRIGERAAIPLGYFTTAITSGCRHYIRMPPFSTFHFPSGNLPPHSTMVGIPPGCRHITPENLLPHYTRLPPLSTWMFTSEILLSPTFHLDVSHPEFWRRMGEEGVSTSYISGSSDSTHPEIDRHFEIFFCIVLRCSPEASRYVRPKLRDILL